MDNANAENTDREKRLFFLDNLRTFIIFLVVVYHAGWVYERSGILSSVWIVDDPSKNNLSGILILILDMFMMPTMFYISGYFASLSLKTKTARHFLVSRFKRLMVPWIVAVMTLLPFYKVIYLYSRNLPQENIGSYFHFTGGILINQGWLWFLPILFLFDMLYVLLKKVNLKSLEIKLIPALLSVFLIGFAYSFCMSMFNGYGWTKTILLDFQNERILIYFMAFLLGALYYRRGVFNKKPAGRKLYYAICATIWIPMNVYIVFLLNLIFNPGKFIISGMADVVMTWFGFHLSLFGLMYILINTFRYYLDRAGTLSAGLNGCSFGVYVIHFIVVGVFAMVLLDIAMPSLAKFVLLTLTVYAVSNLMVFMYRGIKEKRPYS